MQEGWFTDTDGKKYYLQPSDGYMRVSWVQVGSTWYYLDAHGVMQTGWITHSGSKYYLLSSGAMVTGWQTISGSKYYFNTSGAMVTGWQTISSSRYYFHGTSGELMISPTTVNKLTINAYMDTNFKSIYTSTDMLKIIKDLGTPFQYVWNIDFTSNIIASISTTPNDLCSNAISSLCTHSTNAKCDNSLSTDYHHRNANKNLNYIRQQISVPSKALLLVGTSTPLCGVWNNTHATGILGVTYRNTPQTYVTFLNTSTHIHQVRIAQHEISHMFGANDGSCTPGEKCVMSGGFDTASLVVTDIWCTNCKRDFNRTQN